MAQHKSRPNSVSPSRRSESFVEEEECSDSTKSSIKVSGDCQSDLSIATSILDSDDDLKKKFEDYEGRISILENEKKQLNDQLSAVKTKNGKLEKKLQFVKDNQEVFMRLKEAYINMKYNEAAGNKMIEIRERGVQTWDGIICGSCIECEELRRQIELTVQKYSELFVISPGEMEHLMNTVKYLKDLIVRREKSFDISLDKEQKLTVQIAMLEEENQKLLRALESKQIPTQIIEEVKLEQQMAKERKMEELKKFVENITKDTEKLKKIIVKYEKKFRDMQERNPGKVSSPLNDKEARIVHQVVSKYFAKTEKRSPSAGDGQRSFRRSTDRDQRVESLKIQDSSIFMLDSLLFDVNN